MLILAHLLPHVSESVLQGVNNWHRSNNYVSLDFNAERQMKHSKENAYFKASMATVFQSKPIF